MKGLLEWFKSNTKIKRWLFIIIIGVILACYGICKIIEMQSVNFFNLIKIVVSFVFGFTFIILGIIGIQKRTLEVLIEASDDRLKESKKVNMNALIYNKKIYEQGPNVVVIGGGAGLNTVLEGLKKYTENITAIVSVSNYGKTNENDVDILPLDDLKDGIISLAEDKQGMHNLLNYQFTSRGLKKMKFSDILFSTISQNNDNFTKAIESINKILNFKGKVIPVSLDEMEICAELEDETVIKEKDKIPEIVAKKVSKINRIYINPTNSRTTPEVVETIKNADCIIIGPGSLYTNVIPCLLVGGVAKAMKDSKAIKIYINNIMTEPGQTDNYTMSDHIKAVTDHIGDGIIDFCIYDTGEIIPEYVKKYNMDGSDVVEPDDNKVKGIQLVQKNLSTIRDEKIIHNPDAIALSIIEIICDDLRFKDKQNDPKYIMMNAKLKYEKKLNKIPKKSKYKNKNKNKNVKTKGKSKFYELYGERIQSIQDTDKNIKRNRKKINKADTDEVKKKGKKEK